MMDLKDPFYRQLFWIFIYITSVLLSCGHCRGNSFEEGEGNSKSYVSKYGKEYPSLNNKLSVDGFVGNRNPDSFRHIEEEFEKLNADSSSLNQHFQELGTNASKVLKTVYDMDEYLDRWKAILYILQKVYDTSVNGTLPIEKMRKSAAGQMKSLFKSAHKNLPALFVLIDSQIRGTDDPEDDSLLRKYVTKKLGDMTSTSESPISLNIAVNDSMSFLSQLMKLQVRGALLYDMTCAPEDIRCRQRIVIMERDLLAQNNHLKMCTPMLMTALFHEVAKDLYMSKPLTNEVLYNIESQTLSSQQGTVDLASAEVKGTAVKCARRKDVDDDPATWTFESALPFGKLGYFIRGKNECYVGFDRSFLKYIQDELDDRNAAGAEDDEVLLCSHALRPQDRNTQTFTIEPSVANYSSKYKLKNVLTKKYLMTSRTNVLLNDDVKNSHVVNLILRHCDGQEYGCHWDITETMPNCIERKSDSFAYTLILKLYVLIMGVLFIMLIASLVVVCLYRKQIRREYLQYRRVNTQDVIIPPSYRFPSRT
ncbi:uncharacterized protein LOC124270021 [Haliotis rubra]|uniref:uncharacterized protein LOC124270021 n=1 Tax=Haliotis rubra TaxID=36100 RepID=UPI001EE5AA6B|nr:uncharacterized protein LOC124270021 [Haliotis rubra]